MTVSARGRIVSWFHRHWPLRTVSRPSAYLCRLPAGRIGCSWCTDFGFWEAATAHQVSAEKISAVSGWWDSDLLTELERLVLGYAEAMTATPPAVTDELVAQLREHLSEAQLVELTAIIAVENLRSRINAALGLTAQGFTDRCEVQAARS